MRKIFVTIILLGIVAVGAGIIFAKRDQSPTTEKIAVSTSFYPLGYFVRAVGGDDVRVSIITPAGAEPHDFEPTAGDISATQRAKLFVYNGGGVDVWAERLAPDLAKSNIAPINMSDQITAKITASTSDGETATFDPHYWLDPINAQQEVVVIRNALIAADPEHAAGYSDRANIVLGQLAVLDEAYRNTLATCRTRKFYTAHNAFAYLAKRYNLQQIAITGISPDSEPSPEQLAAIAAQARQEGISYIFFESLVSPKLSQTVATEIGAKTLVLNPIEGLTDDELKAGEDYLSVMRENLSNLALALDCRS